MPQPDFVMILTGRAHSVRYDKTILVGNWAHLARGAGWGTAELNAFGRAGAPR